MFGCPTHSFGWNEWDTHVLTRGEGRMPKTALVAVGGNSLIRAGEKGTIAEQLANTRRTAAAIRSMIELGYRLVVTHGNGPQVGAQLLRSERASDVTYSQTLDVCGAASQGEIGYLLAQSLNNEFAVGLAQDSGGLCRNPDRGVGRRSGDASSLQTYRPVLLAKRRRRKTAHARLADRGRCRARIPSRRSLTRAAGDCRA